MPTIHDQLAQNGSAQQQNCVTSAQLLGYYQSDPWCELRQLVAKMREAMEPKDEKAKRLEARVAELEDKLAAVKKAAG